MAQRTTLPLHGSHHHQHEQASTTNTSTIGHHQHHHQHHRIRQQDESHFIISEVGSSNHHHHTMSVPLSDLMDKEQRVNPSDLLLRMMKKRASESRLVDSVNMNQ